MVYSGVWQQISRYREDILVVGFTLFLAVYYLVENVRLHKLLWYVLLGVAVLFILRWKEVGRMLAQPLGAAIACYFSYQLVSLSWSEIANTGEFTELARKSLFTLLFVVISAFYFKCMSRSEGKSRSLFVLSGGAMFSALCALCYWVFGDGVGEERLSGFGRALNPIQAACLYSIASITSFYGLLSCQKRREKGAALRTAAWGVLWCILLVALIATQSRGAWLGAIFGHVVLYRGRGPNMKLTLVASGLGIAMLALSSLFIDWTSIIARADGFRFHVWSQVIDGWMSSPFLGLGYRAPFEMEVVSGYWIYQPHSLYLSALYYGGVPGVALLLLPFAFSACLLWKHRNQSTLSVLILALLVNGMVIGLFDFDLLIVNVGIEWPLFWLPVAGALAIEAVRRESGEADAHTA